MRKLILMSALILGSLFTIPTMAQNQDRWHRQDGYQRQERHQREYRNYTYTVIEYRYIHFGRDIYKETYRSTYTRNGFLINRILIDRERIRDWNRRDNRMRFNIFLRF